jgi:hypothetical protein
MTAEAIAYFKRASFDRVRIAMQVGESSQYFVGWGTLALINAGLAQSTEAGSTGFCFPSSSVRSRL